MTKTELILLKWQQFQNLVHRFLNRKGFDHDISSRIWLRDVPFLFVKEFASYFPHKMILASIDDTAKGGLTQF